MEWGPNQAVTTQMRSKPLTYATSLAAAISSEYFTYFLLVSRLALYLLQAKYTLGFD